MNSLLKANYFIYRHLFGEKSNSKYRNFLTKTYSNKIIESPFYDFPEDTNPQIIKNVYSNQIPFVLRNGADSWPCMKKWDLDFLRKRYGSQEILTDVQATDIKVDFKKAQKIELCTLNEYLDELLVDTKKYLRFAPFIQNNKELERDLDITWLEDFKSWHSQGPIYHFFLGRAGSRSRLHCANSDNIFTQVLGKKNWILLPPKALFSVHPQNYRSAINFESDIDLRNKVDEDRYPLAKNLRPINVTCNEGDILYIPPYYWHDVLNESISLGVSTRFISGFRGIAASPLMFFLNLLGTNPSIFNMKIDDKLNESLYMRKSHGHNV